MIDLNDTVNRVKSAAGMKKLETDDPTIEFATKKEMFGAIPEPTPANKVLPDWYRNLEPDHGEGINMSTVKKCAPFLDAMTAGWIIPLAGDVEIHGDGSSSADVDWMFPEPLVDEHSLSQVGGMDFPLAPNPVMKFINFWSISVPDGYSVMFTPPMNRVERRFQVFSGIVDCDNYYNEVNFPFVLTEVDIDGVIPAGTPLVQAIPFKRDGILSDAVVRERTEEEDLEMKRTQVAVGSRAGVYREERWQHKKGSRNIPEPEDDEESGGSCPFHR